MTTQDLAQKILNIAQDIIWKMEVYKIELLLRDAPYDPEKSVEDIMKICQEQLQKEGK